MRISGRVAKFMPLNGLCNIAKSQIVVINIS